MYENFKEFIECYNSQNIEDRKENWHEHKNPDGRWRKFSINNILKRDKTNLDILWINDHSLTDLENLPDPDLISSEIIENIESSLNNLREISSSLSKISKN